MAREKRLVVVSARVDQSTAEALKRLAEADDRPLSKYIERLLKQHVTEKGEKPEKPQKKGGRP
jgi:predicted transcriptional regulator